MQEIIKVIESRNYSNIDLLVRAEDNYKLSKEYYDEFKKKYEKLQVEDELWDSYIYLRKATDSYKDFKENLKFESEGRNNSKMWEEFTKDSKKLWKMRSSWYWYRAYKSLLEDRINSMDYEYYNEGL